MISKNKAVFGILSAVALIAIAKTWGPFHVSAAGPRFATTTFSQDATNGYQAAQTLANAYLTGPMSNPITRFNAVQNDRVRVVYYDGQIFDFDIDYWPGTSPLKDPIKVASATQQAPASPYWVAKEKEAERKCFEQGKNSSFTYPTGQWSSTLVEYSKDVWGTTAFWVDTGIVTVRYTDCSGK